MKLTNLTIVAARAEVENAEKNLTIVTYKVVSRCKHRDIAECDYMSGDWSSLPPARVCLKCGVAEEGWGSRYRVLETENLLKRIDRSTLYQLRTVWFTDDDKGPLIRKEVTVNELLKTKLGIT